ncbi:hypothetical protein M885DRAFT_562941 [Pelagophyceae sp. CCMP2097]|nr:hypothetical protein M885DRAFT_562941 [Pelagophyceae sp. CCMP2097]
MKYHSHLASARVADLCFGKQVLVDVEARSTVGSCLELLDSLKVLSVPVYGAAGAWVGAGGVDLAVGPKQYIGIVSVLDLVAHVFRASGYLGTHVDEARLAAALQDPVVQALGESNESLSLWVEQSSSDGLWALELFSKGVHRAMVPPRHDGDETRLLTQTDAVRYIAAHRFSSVALHDLLGKSLVDLGISAGGQDGRFGAKRQDVVAINESAELIPAIFTLLREGVNAAAVVDGAGALVSTLSLSDLRGTVAPQLAAFHGLSVGAFLRRRHHLPDLPKPLTCKSIDYLGDVIEALLGCEVHRAWFVDSNGKPTNVVTFTDVIDIVYRSELALAQAPPTSLTDIAH